MKSRFLFLGAVLILATAACTTAPLASVDPLVGAWRGGVQFESGAFAAVKDLEFMYAFQAGGTMTESSNYDGAPPVPPAYGVWRRVADGTYELKYEFYWTKPPANFDEIAKGGGWAPGGRGVLTQHITLSADGNAFTGTLRLETFDSAGKPTDPPSAAAVKGARIRF